jgi:hypothetical protein
LTDEKSARRVFETASFFTATAMPGALGRFGSGFKAAAKVRREATPDAMAPPSALDILRRPLSQRILHLNSSKGQQRLLRLSVEPGGCSGFSYKFNMAEAATVDAEEDV